MAVAYLVPSLMRPSLALVEEDFKALSGVGNQLAVRSGGSMCEDLCRAFAETDAEIVRNCADDDRYPPEANRLAVELMEATPLIDVLVAGGTKVCKAKDVAVCVPLGAWYGASLASVAEYGACGSGLFMRRGAVERCGLLNYSGRLIDNFIVLEAIAKGAVVAFLRLNTYTHAVSAGDNDYKAFRREKRELWSRYRIQDIRHKPYESPPVWDGQLA